MSALLAFLLLVGPATAAAKLSKSVRERRMDAISRAMLPCLEQQREAGVAALADRRAGA